MTPLIQSALLWLTLAFSLVIVGLLVLLIIERCDERTRQRLLDASVADQAFAHATLPMDAI